MRFIFFLSCFIAGLGPAFAIIGGRIARPGEFPFIVSLRSNGNHLCGGAILNGNSIVTAANCIYQLLSIRDISVVVGTNTLNEGGQALPVASLILHEYWDPRTFLNDIAIVKLAAPMQFSPTVQPIQLSGQNPALHDAVNLTGWGLTSYPGAIPNNLQKLESSILDPQTCVTQLAGPAPMPVTSGNICTLGIPGHGACQGDLGGPVVGSNGDLVGIISWGVPCANGYPDVHTSVAFYRDWLQRVSGAGSGEEL